MAAFTKGQCVIYWRLANQLHPTQQIRATYCSEYHTGKWKRHHISFVGDDGEVVHRYVSIAAIRADTSGEQHG